MTLLDIRDLTIALDGRLIVDGVSLHVAQGERVGIIGESGSGKSITCMSVLGLAPARARVTGSILLDGAQIVGADAVTLRGIRGRAVGCVFQEPQSALDPLMTIGHHLTAALRAQKMLPRRERTRRAVLLAETVGLPEPEGIIRRYPHELSGGQRQRVMIAMAMSTEPRLLLADEPTTALDVTVQARILALMSDLVSDRGTGSLFVTHDMAVAMSFCDRIVVMQRGRIVEEGSPESLIGNPATRYTSDLVDAAYDTGWQPQTREADPA